MATMRPPPSSIPREGGSSPAFSHPTFNPKRKSRSENTLGATTTGVNIRTDTILVVLTAALILYAVGFNAYVGWSLSSLEARDRGEGYGASSIVSPWDAALKTGFHPNHRQTGTGLREVTTSKEQLRKTKVLPADQNKEGAGHHDASATEEEDNAHPNRNKVPTAPAAKKDKMAASFLRKEDQTNTGAKFRSESSMAVDETSERTKDAIPPSWEQDIAFVYMVHKRVDYFKVAMESLRQSDFPRDAPLIISHDGHVPEMVDFVESSLKHHFHNVIQLFHPSACYDHPHEFPADAPELNKNYGGDQYGNPREKWVTCAKHHWWWMMNKVWSLLGDDTDGVVSGSLGNVKSMLFMEEDYTVAPTIYESCQTGMELVTKEEENGSQEYFGLILERHKGGKRDSVDERKWLDDTFVTGPFVLRRSTWGIIQNASNEFCTFDEYNWDWTVVHLQNTGVVTGRVLRPGVPQVRHRGSKGMHGEEKGAKVNEEDAPPFHGKVISPRRMEFRRKKPHRGYGGWGHPKDHEHCIDVAKSFAHPTATTSR